MPYNLFKRQTVPQQYAEALQTLVIPAPTRGLIESENEAYMQPGGSIVQDNWVTTLRGIKLRGGSQRWCDLHALDGTVPPTPSPLRKPVISAFEYASGGQNRMYAAQATKLFDVTTQTPVLVKSGQASGNYCAAQLENAAGDWLIAVNDAGDFPLRTKDGTTWVTLDPGAGAPSDGAAAITYSIPPAGVTQGKGLSYVWKYRNRLFFIEAGSMNAWFLPTLNSVGGVLELIPLAGAFTKGGYLLFGATWSVDAGDGIDDKIVFVTNLGEAAIFTGTNPADPANWRQEGRYNLGGSPMGMNAHLLVGGDLLVLTTEGIVPVSQAITKEAGQLELAMLTRNIKKMWRAEVAAKRSWAWTAKSWPEYGGLFVTWPGGPAGNRYCAVANNTSIAWSRLVGYDATCFVSALGDMFFGTQDGWVLQADRTGFDDARLETVGGVTQFVGNPYYAVVVGGWEMFGAPASTVVWHQARASFFSSSGQPFQPRLSATINYLVVIPPPPPPGPDPINLSLWDRGLWGPTGAPRTPALWDQPAVTIIPARNTMWVSIGQTGFAHAPIVQVTVAQQARPDVELIAISSTFNRAGVNV